MIAREFAFTLEAVRHQLSPDFTLCIDALSIHAGKTLCLVGPTGAGKSTLLRLLSGLVPVSSGSIHFSGETWATDKSRVQTIRSLALVPQRPLLLSTSVRKNVEYALTLRGEKDVREKIDQILERLDLQKLQHQNAHTLSGGQIQLVALARALVLQPTVLLLDEPTAHLDPAHVSLVEECISLQQQMHQTTIIWAMHHLFQARRRADRVAFLLHGHLIEETHTNSFFEQPTDSRTADFIHGKMVY